MPQKLCPYKPLNARQTQFRDFIHAFHSQHRRLPSRLEIARGMGRKDGGYISRVVIKLRHRGELPRVSRRREID